MIVEYHLVSNSKVIVLLNGLPSLPDKKDVITVLGEKGYSVFVPRYLGTWESEGEFLKESPVNEIDSLITKLKNGIQLEDNEHKFEEVNVIGSSFGGAIGFCLNTKKLVNKLILISPVFDFTVLDDMDSLKDYLKGFFPGAYRFSDSNWQKLSSGQYLSPISNDFTDANKHLIIGGTQDTEILLPELKKFAESKSIKFIELTTEGHMSLSRLKEESNLNYILEFINS